jgi:hypothetical protein
MTSTMVASFSAAIPVQSGNTQRLAKTPVALKVFEFRNKDRVIDCV